MSRYEGYVTSFLEKMKKNLWERYVFGGREAEDYDWYCEICQELAKRKGGVMQDGRTADEVATPHRSTAGIVSPDLLAGR